MVQDDVEPNLFSDLLYALYLSLHYFGHYYGRFIFTEERLYLCLKALFVWTPLLIHRLSPVTFSLGGDWLNVYGDFISTLSAGLFFLLKQTQCQLKRSMLES